MIFVTPFHLGNIHVLRKQKGGREGVSQMLTIAYVGGGGAKGSCLRNDILEKKFALDRKITKKSCKKCIATVCKIYIQEL